MKLSIVTANFNYGRFLPQCLESVWRQVGLPIGSDGVPLEIEHIVIDGVSSDGSVDFLRRWASEHSGEAASHYSFRWISEPDHGQTDAINKGLRMAAGDVVAWLNADEYYLPGKLAKMAEEFLGHPESDFIYGEPLYMDADNRPIRIKRDHPFSKFVLLHYGCVIPSCCSFWRRKILDDGHYLDSSYKVIMDGEYYCRLVRAGCRFRYIPATIAAFIWHGSNVSTTFEAKRLEEQLAIKSKYTGCSAVMLRLTSPVAHLWRRALVMLRIVFFDRESVEKALNEKGDCQCR